MKRVERTLTVFLFFFAAPLLRAQQSSDRLRELESRMGEIERRLDALSASSDQATRQAVEELRRQIDALTREIETLRSGVPEKKSEAAPTRAFGLSQAASRVYASDRGVSIGGYGEAVYESFERRRQDGAPSEKSDRIDLARIVFYFGYKFNERFLFNSEIEYEHASTGVGAEEKGEVSVEFGYLDFLLGKGRAVARAGLVLVPLGFINELHEPPVFLGARRPQVETRILPSTWRELGVGVAGEAGPFTYRAYLVNGLDAARFEASSGVRGGRQEGSQALAQNFAATARLDYTGAPGFLVGAGGYSGKSAQGARADGHGFDGRVSILEAHAEWRWRGIQVRALAVSGAIGDAARINALRGVGGKDSVAERFRGAYAEAGYDVLLRRGGESALVPFARYERFNTQDRVPAGFEADPANDVRLWTLGLDYRPIQHVAIKADYEICRNAARTGVNQWNLALGWLF